MNQTIAQTEKLIAVNTVFKLLRVKRRLQYELASHEMSDFDELCAIQEISEIDIRLQS